MERTYVFNQDGNNGNGGGSKFDIMAMLPNLMGSKGILCGGLLLYRPYHRRPSAGWMQGAGFGECL